MACFFPMYRLPEETVVKFLPARYQNRIRNKGLIIKKVEYDQLLNYVPSSLWQQVPCGMCIGCRSAYSREFAIRCLMEQRYSDNSHFITLTYADHFLPVQDFYDPLQGEIYQRAVLVKRDFQLFMKRLRKQLPEGVRVFGCGEFGELYKRPHFHAILFNAPLDDLKLRLPAEQNNGNALYMSDLIQNTWNKGLTSVGQVNYQTCAYVAGYVQKKELGYIRSKEQAREEMLKRLIPPDQAPPAPIEILKDRQPFLISSRRPGIGRKYFDDHAQDIYLRDQIMIKYKDQVQVIQPPRYYDRLFDLDHHEELLDLKAKRLENAQWQQGYKCSLTDLTLDELRLKEYDHAMEQAKLIRRSHIEQCKRPGKPIIQFRDLW